MHAFLHDENEIILQSLEALKEALKLLLSAVAGAVRQYMEQEPQDFDTVATAEIECWPYGSRTRRMGAPPSMAGRSGLPRRFMPIALQARNAADAGSTGCG